MVQRKVINKLGIQADAVKSEKLLINLKPSSLQQHEVIKNRGTDLTKKMKKSGSMKRQDFERLRSPNLRKKEPPPLLGKPPPPPLALATGAVTPLKQLPIKAAVDMTPNYMKSTSSSEARKGKSQVSSRSSNSLKVGSVSSNKQTRMLSRTSSLKMMRTLTKSPSFKPARISSKKCSAVVLCENLDVQRATCSSTLKDSKFPSYLELNPGGTETEGTSTMKVCPYTYCSLNGHRHAPVLPLKYFLLARSRAIKNQRNVKFGCLSPRQSPPVGGGVKFDEKVLNQDDLNGSVISPLIQEEHGDFHIEIYGVTKEDTADQNRIDQSSSHCSVTDPVPSMVTDLVHSMDSNDGKVEENEYERFMESLWYGPFCSDSDSDERFDQNEDVFSTEICTAALFPEENHENEVAEEIITQKTPITQSDELDSDASDMEWEAGQYSAFYLDDDCEIVLEATKGGGLNGGDLFEVDSGILLGERFGKPDDNFDEIPADDESWSSEEWSSKDDCESTGSNEYLDILNTNITSILFEAQIGKLEAAEEETDDIVLSDLVIQRMSVQTNDEEMQTIVMVEDGTLDGPVVNVCNITSAGSLDERYENNIGSHSNTEEYQSDAAKIYPLDKETFTGGILPICEDSETDEICIKLQLSTSDNGHGGELKNQADATQSIMIEACVDDGIPAQTDGSFDEQSQTSNREYQGQLVNHCNQAENFQKLIPIDSEKEPCLGMSELNVAESVHRQVQKEAAASATNAKTEDACLTSPTSRTETEETCKNLKETGRSKRSTDESVESREFNPRGPNYLPLEPDPEGEKVDLKHQMMDERKNAEEWMLDYALRQTVTKLGAARKRKVALLVEAFEKVLPITKCEPHLQHSSAALGHARPIQACR